MGLKSVWTQIWKLKHWCCFTLRFIFGLALISCSWRCFWNIFIRMFIIFNWSAQCKSTLYIMYVKCLKLYSIQCMQLCQPECETRLYFLVMEYISRQSWILLLMRAVSDCLPSPLQDSNRTLYWDTPDLTECFQMSVLSWIPCIYLWLTFPFYFLYLKKNNKGYIMMSLLNRVKMVKMNLILFFCPSCFFFLWFMFVFSPLLTNVYFFLIKINASGKISVICSY